MRIAALQDDPAQALATEQALTLRGYRCCRFRDGRALMLALRRERFDMLLLDWESPGIAARDVLVWVRRTFGGALPVLLLAASHDDPSVCQGLAQRADGLAAKPVRGAELAARVGALTRRLQTAPRAGIDVVLDRYRFASAQRRAWLSDRPVQLAPREFDLALLLFRHVGQLVLRQTIVDEVWRRVVPECSRTIDSHLSRIRTKLGLWPHNGVRLSRVDACGWRLDRVEAQRDASSGATVAAVRRQADAFALRERQ